MAITPGEKRRYPLVGKDAEILERIHGIESIKNLSPNEWFLLRFLRSQLEKDWRTPCLRVLRVWTACRNLHPAKRWNKLKKLQTKWWLPGQK
jgi:hypothetical protein